MKMASLAAAAVAVVWFLFSKREKQSTQNDATATDDNNTDASTSASTSSLPEGGVYEVFLSFCGIDTRKVFTDSLYTALVTAGIQTFRDDNELRVGKEISVELLKSIRESKILIPIFSKNYAASKWCLLELEQMVECHNNGTQIIYPLFYDVDPSDVRNQRGSYEKAFCQHKKKFSKDVLQRWRDALTMIGGLKGLELEKETNGHHGEFVRLVVEDVLMKLEKKYMHEPQNLVGMDHHIEKLMELLEVESKDVRIIGIHGMGGLGKTTMATVIYNKLCEHFEGHCFLDDVREKSKNIVELQKQLISEILSRKVDESFVNVNQGRKRIKNVIFRKKLLIVLDDVDNISQVTDLVGHQNWLGLQSRIIITTRYRDVLDVIERDCQTEDPCVIYKSYNPEIMDDVDSLQLFCKYAFKRDSPVEGYYDPSMEVVSIAKGLPLVLVVVGSTFYTITDKDLWEDRLGQLKEIPNMEVMEKLKFSFDALQYNEKQIFLDIACFFIGYQRTRPCYLWESCGFYPRTVINVLVSRSLITIDDHDQLRMHDQLRDLGRQIVREEGLRNNNPAEQSRLLPKEAMQILKTYQGTSNITALSILTSEDVVAPYFRNLPNLRFLNIMKLYGDDGVLMNLIFRSACVRLYSVDGDFKNLLPNLRWFQCTSMELEFSQKNLNMKNLVILELISVRVANDWDGWNELKKANNLKVLTLSWCQNLQTLLDLSNLTKLVELRLPGCSVLTEIQGLEKLESLKILEANWCEKLNKIEGVEGLICLELLELGNCNELKGLRDLSKLNKLKILKAPRLDNTKDFSHFKFLKEMEIYSSNIIEIPGITKLEFLRVLSIRQCEELLEVEGIGVLKNMESLEIKGCSKLQKLPNLQNLKSLKSLKIECLNLDEIQGLEELKSLEFLSVKGCNSIEALPDFSGLEKLKELDVSDCVKLSQITGIQELKSLTILNIRGSLELQGLPDFPNVKILRTLHHWPYEEDESLM